MRRTDNPQPRCSCSFSLWPATANLSWLCLSLLFACGLAGCDRVGNSRYAQLMQDADNKSAQGDFERAVNLYEAALDDSPRGAEVHYKLALLYDDKLNDPVSALHHFKRYLALSPNGPHAKDVNDSIKRDGIAALTALSGDSVITRAEAARLRNENLTLHKQLEERERHLRSLKEPTPGKPDQRKQAKPTLCSRATHSSRFRESFINLRNVGKPSLKRTKRMFAIQKTLRSVKRWSFRKNPCSRDL
jgi:tetratricopeptide (TPR) repeat protein